MTVTMMIKILIAEDQTMISGALAALLNLEDDFEVLATAGNGQEALKLCEQLQPDVLISDIEMPIMTGLTLASEIQAKRLKTKIVVLTTFARSGYLKRALLAGVSAYLLKDAPTDSLAAAIRTVVAGGKVIAPELAIESWGSPNDPLSEKERQILRLAGGGASNQEIAQSLFLSEGTVRNYLSEAMSKLNAKNRIEAFHLAQDQGWL